jgi:hypothetical protein
MSTPPAKTHIETETLLAIQNLKISIQETNKTLNFIMDFISDPPRDPQLMHASHYLNESARQLDTVRKRLNALGIYEELPPDLDVSGSRPNKNS